MGLRGLHARSGTSGYVEKTLRPISRQAIEIYRRMRAHEHKHGGPGGDDDIGREWWSMNAALAREFGLYEGMVVYEDPAWEYPRAFQTDIDMFHRLERAARKQPKKKNGYRYKWQK